MVSCPKFGVEHKSIGAAMAGQDRIGRAADNCLLIDAGLHARRSRVDG